MFRRRRAHYKRKLEESLEERAHCSGADIPQQRNRFLAHLSVRRYLSDFLSDNAHLSCRIVRRRVLFALAAIHRLDIHFYLTIRY